MVADRAAMLRMPGHHMLSITKSFVHAQGIELSMTVGDSIRSLSDLSKELYDVLGAVGDALLLIFPLLDTSTLRYWFFSHPTPLPPTSATLSPTPPSPLQTYP